MRFKLFSIRIVIVSVALVTGVIVGAFAFDYAEANKNSNQSHSPDLVYAQNENGQTYGSLLYAKSPDDEPDLIEAFGVDGTFGYVRKVELDGPKPASPKEALALQSKKESVRVIPLYDVDGKTVIGEFHVENGEVTEYPSENEAVK